MKVINVEALLNKYSNNKILYNLLKDIIDDEEVMEIKDNVFHNKKVRTTFKGLGIPVGSKLVFVENHDITCMTIDDKNQVSYNGKEYSLSRLVRELKWSPTNVYNSYRGYDFFMYNGKVLTSLREEV